MYQSRNHFCRFYVHRHVKSGSYCAGTEVGFPAPHLAVIKRGSCRIERGDGDVLYANVGDVWFIPKGTPYTSFWSTDDFVSFDKIEFEADHLSLYYRTMQVFSLPQAIADFDLLYNEWQAQNEWGYLAAYYQLLGRVVPLLEKSNNPSMERILPALIYLREHASESVKVETLASLCYMSESSFFEVFRAAVGVSPIRYKNTIRLLDAQTLLMEGETVESVCEVLNFSSPSHLRRMMKQYLGHTPKEIKQGVSI